MRRLRPLGWSGVRGGALVATNGVKGAVLVARKDAKGGTTLAKRGARHGSYFASQSEWDRPYGRSPHLPRAHLEGSMEPPSYIVT